ncbi:hypothetical protein H9L10_01385 [Phycicoccus endophyticus]|uniref:Phosphotransferase n=1 Tax=Phycicoccus endophyticus TaxID=1690220 RepID=A0A7G9R2F3_9MICO|nr:hypothetical protein [Phycicoccus endophyticus]NHI20838.1 hypothetical protein [Phycicoccus endophyticus]QNN49778.1 hypothetical protein H9L10_01385 [Phycicoccus endophyticus]
MTALATGSNRRSRQRLKAMSTVVRTLGTWVLPWRLVVTPSPEPGSAPLVDWLEEQLGSRPLVGVKKTAPRANNKPVLVLLDADGGVLGYAKVGINPLTQRLVKAETKALGRIAARSIPGLRTPELLASGEWNGSHVLVQGALRPTGDQSWAPEELIPRFAAFAGSAGLATTPLRSSPYLERLRRRLRKHRAYVPGALGAELERVVTAAGDVPLTLGSWHGDWTPWNMGRDGDDLLLWDLERVKSGVPAGFDAVHYTLQSEIVRKGTPPLAAARSLLEQDVTLAASSLQASRRLLARLYLIEIGTRYCVDRQAEAGGALSDLGSWLLPALAGPLREEALHG